MRRVLVSLLLGLLTFPLIGPALTAGAGPDLPACCRRDGKHHCAMMDMADAQDDGPLFKAPQSKCPLFPAQRPATGNFQTVLLSTVPRVVALETNAAAAPKFQAGAPAVFHPYSVPKRGPPSLL